MKTECVRRTTFTTRTDADLALFAYIDGPCCPIDLTRRGRGLRDGKCASVRVDFRSTRRRVGSG
ncbi:hypothetical protein [Kitasatospora sp. NPDC054795]